MPGNDMVFQHMGVAVADLQCAIRDYHDIFGYVLLSGPFDDPAQKVSVCFVGKANQPQIELIAPLGPESPIKRLLSSGGGAYHFCYSVTNIDQTLADVRAKGCIVIGTPVPAVAFGGRKIAWFYTPARQLVEILEREPIDDSTE